MNASTFMFFSIMIIVWVLLLIATSLIPYFSRKNVAFGISVPESEYGSEFLTKLRRSYFAAALSIGILLGVGSNLVPIWIDISISVWIQMACLMLYLIITVGLYLIHHFKVKQYKQNSSWEITNTVSALLTVEHNEKKPISPWWFSSYIFIAAATFAAAILQYPNLPDQIPMHYNIAGEVDRYAAKSIATFLNMPVMQLILGLLFIGIYFAILSAKAQSSGGEIDEGLKRDRSFKKIMADFIFYIGLAVLLIFSVIQLSMLGMINISFMSAIPVVFLVIVFALVIFLIVKVGQGGSRMGSRKNTAQSTVSDDDANWILGGIYFNKSDPSLFVEKRFGMGYTVNLGNPKSLIAIVILAVIIAGITILPNILK